MKNIVRCKKCNSIIKSYFSYYDVKWCKCGAVVIFGGKEYLGRVGHVEDYEDLSKTKIIKNIK